MYALGVASFAREFCVWGFIVGVLLVLGWGLGFCFGFAFGFTLILPFDVAFPFVCCFLGGLVVFAGCYVVLLRLLCVGCGCPGECGCVGLVWVWCVRGL